MVIILSNHLASKRIVACVRLNTPTLFYITASESNHIALLDDFSQVKNISVTHSYAHRGHISRCIKTPNRHSARLQLFTEFEISKYRSIVVRFPPKIPSIRFMNMLIVVSKIIRRQY